MAIADQGRALNGQGTLDGPTGTLPAVYQLPGSDFHDITTGNNGYAAGSGYDLVTGRGTPIVNVLAEALAGGTTTSPTPTPTPIPTPTPTIGSLTINPAKVKAGKDATFTAEGVLDTGGAIASVAFYQETNGSGGLQLGSDALIGTGTQTGGNTWSLSASTKGVPPGTYTVYAIATDAAGVSSTLLSVQLTVR